MKVAASNKEIAERIKHRLINEEGRGSRLMMTMKYEQQLFKMTDEELINWYKSNYIKIVKSKC